MLILPAMAATLVSAGQDASTLELSAPADIASAVGDCWQAVGAAGVDLTRLGSEGWSLVPETAKDAAGPLEAFAKQGANHLIMLAKAPETKRLCTVIARVSSKDDARSTLNAIQKTLQTFGTKAPAAPSEGGVMFISSPRYAQVDLTDAAGGTEEQPAMRIMVFYMPEQK
jgi:hypothetical protein